MYQAENGGRNSRQIANGILQNVMILARHTRSISNRILHGMYDARSLTSHPLDA